MKLVITIRQDVRDTDEGTEAYNWVVAHLAEAPELKISGHLTNHFEPKPEEPPS
ncbi:hypothetical protein ES703_44586 [subsurface metagenome]